MRLRSVTRLSLCKCLLCLLQLHASVRPEGFKAQLNLKANYLQEHRNSVAVVPRLISEENATRLRRVVDNRWRHISLAEVQRLAEEGGDGDDLVDAVDEMASYASDILDRGRCTAGGVDSYTNQDDCELAHHLLAHAVTPALTKAINVWREDGAASDLPSTLFPCSSFVKRYLPGERHGLHAHRDMSSLVTANVLLTSPTKFMGGLEMFPDADHLTHNETEDEHNGYLDDKDLGKGVFLEHGADTHIGDFVMHRGSRWHGVRILDAAKSERYSWITWFTANQSDCESAVKYSH